jgi:predicted ArsR family transcriptional regulator
MNKGKRVREGYYSEQIRNEAFAYVNLNKQQERVLEIIKKWQPISNDRIAAHLGCFVHQVTPRVLELRNLGLVEYCGEAESTISKRKVSLWRINPNGCQLTINFP